MANHEARISRSPGPAATGEDPLHCGPRASLKLWDWCRESGVSLRRRASLAKREALNQELPGAIHFIVDPLQGASSLHSLLHRTSADSSWRAASHQCSGARGHRGTIGVSSKTPRNPETCEMSSGGGCEPAAKGGDRPPIRKAPTSSSQDVLCHSVHADPQNVSKNFSRKFREGLRLPFSNLLGRFVRGY